MGGLWRRAGLRAAPVRLVSHAIAQVHYDGGWHVLDGDLQHLFLLRDNETVAGDQALARDHDLVKRTHTLGLLLADDRTADEWQASLYVHEGEVTGERGRETDTTMDLTLRPGEALVWRWGHLSPVKRRGDPTFNPNYPDTFCNGLWEYRPDLTRERWRQGAATVEHVRSGPDGVHAEEGKPGTIIWTMRSPYVFVGGRLEAEGSGARFALSWDGERWEDVGEDLDPFFPPQGAARYQYQLRCRLSGPARLRHLRVVNDLQMALLTQPEMVVGENGFVYTDETPGERTVRITHEWVERSVSRPPEAPPAPIHPPDGGEASGTDVVFRWTAPEAPAGEQIADYHFELADRADMRWPLSMSFYKLISRTADRGKAQYTVPAPGLLTPDRQYFWRVRARNDAGVWGPWGKTWSFTPRGPAYPLEVTVDYDHDTGVGVLRWRPNPVGRKPVRYRVYGSDEKGFSVSDEPYEVTIGEKYKTGAVLITGNEYRYRMAPVPFPANFVAETATTELEVTGAAVALPAANTTYFRVVAVDGRGKRSGPSDFATAPRPVIYSPPVTAARVGTAYRYQVLANRSLGDLRCRVVDGKEARRYWDVETPSYVLERGPPWLRLDEATGLLHGTPDAAGHVAVAVTATIERVVRQLDERALGRGREHVLSTGTERVGSATQRFDIEVRA